MNYGYIYYTKNELNGKMYIGKVTSRTLSNKPNYRGSGIEILEAIKNEGYQNFTTHYIAAAKSSEELTQLEKYYLIYYKIPNDLFYNINLATSNSEQSEYFNNSNKNGINLKDIICYNIKTKETMVFNNITNFCRDHNMTRGCVFNVMSGQRVTHKDCVFWYKDYPISSDALNWILNYKLGTNYKTKYVKINEVKDELSMHYKKAQNKIEAFEFNGYYIEDNKEVAVEWDEINKLTNLLDREGDAPIEEQLIPTIEVNKNIDNKFENPNRPHEYILDGKEKSLYFNYDEINAMSKIYLDITPKLIRQAISRKQKTVMNKKYNLIFV